MMFMRYNVFFLSVLTAILLAACRADVSEPENSEGIIDKAASIPPDSHAEQSMIEERTAARREAEAAFAHLREQPDFSHVDVVAVPQMEGAEQ